MAQIAAPAEARPSVDTHRGLVRDLLLIASAILMALTLFLVFFWVPTDANLGISQRIFYFHVPLAWLGMISIVVVAFASVMYLITRKDKWDSFAYSTAELGVVFLSLLLAAGIAWNKPVWGVWWTWDARLTTTLILWFIYVSYLMLRAYGPKGSQGARYGAVVALIGAIDTPIIYMATVWWRTVHPEMNVGPLAEDSALDSSMGIALMVSTVTFTVLYVYMLIERYSLKRSEAGVDELYQHVSHTDSV
jgi:heme exporter protein C